MLNNNVAVFLWDDTSLVLGLFGYLFIYLFFIICFVVVVQKQGPEPVRFPNGSLFGNKKYPQYP